MKKLSRSAMCGIGMTAAVCALLARSEYEKDHFVTERYEIRSPKIRTPRRLVFLTDLHEKEFGRDNMRLKKELLRIQPDALLIGGDMVTCPWDREEFKAALSLVKFAASRWPVFYAPGNHEDRMRYRATPYFSGLEEAGVRFLENDSVLFGEDIRISGARPDHSLYRHRLTRPVMSPGYIGELLGDASEDRFQILLFHTPLFFRECADWGADLTLSGHFHGGTIRLPWFGGLMTPQYQFFCRECAGRFDRDGKTMIVGRGLGTHSVNIRLNDLPQVMVIELLPGEA